MSNAKVGFREFVKRYIPLQRAGKNRAEIAGEFEMDEKTFNTKLSNTTLELYVASMLFEVDGQDEPISGAEFATAYREVLRKQRLADAEAATYEGGTDKDGVEFTAEDAREKAIEKAAATTTLDAMRVIRQRVNKGDKLAEKVVNLRSDWDGPRPVELETPVGGRGSKDYDDILDISRILMEGGELDTDDSEE